MKHYACKGQNQTWPPWRNIKMAKERYANTLPFCGVKDGHDALVVAIHTFMIEAGYKCIGIGEEVCFMRPILYTVLFQCSYLFINNLHAIIAISLYTVPYTSSLYFVYGEEAF